MSVRMPPQPRCRLAFGAGVLLRQPNLQMALAVCLGTFAVATPALAQDTSSSREAPTSPPSSARTGGSDEQNEIVVSAAPSERSSIDRTTYIVHDNVEARSSNVLKILSHVPSIDVTPSGQLRLFGRSGVKILIDGHEVANPLAVLQNLQGSQIVQIEVISNPSAQFSAQGTAGIINLITRRSHPSGLGGSLNATGGTFGSYDAKAVPTWTRGPLSISGSLGMSRSISRTNVHRERFGLDSASDITSQESEIRESRIRNDTLTSSLSATYRISNRDSLSLSAMAIQSHSHRSAQSTIESSDIVDILDQTLDQATRFHSFDYAAEYRREGSRKGENLTIAASGSTSSFFTNSEFSTVGRGSRGMFILRDSSPNSSASLKADYVRPGGADRLMTLGASIERQSTTISSFDEGDLPLGGVAAPATSTLSGAWTDKAVYLTYQFPFHGIKLLPGLRVESRRYHIAGGAGASSGGAHLFPTLHVEWRLSRSTRLDASYSRRIAWPDIGSLNPAVRFSDSTTATAGSQFLRPEITDSFEAKVSTGLGKQSLDVTAFSRRTRDLFSNLIELSPDNVLISRNVNLGVLTLRGVDISVRGPIGAHFHYSATGDLSAETISDDVIDRAFLKSRPRYSLVTMLEYYHGVQEQPGADHARLTFRYYGPVATGLVSSSSYSSLSGSWSHVISRRLAGIFDIGSILIPPTTRATSYSPSSLARDFYRPVGFRMSASLSYTLGPMHRP
jgi:outer membrane receptor for ferrienterochelin and colicins